MKRSIVLVLILFGVLLTLIAIQHASPASADWRWAEPKLKPKRVKPVCNQRICRTLAKIETRARLKARIQLYNRRKQAEWNTWTRLYIPDCTWFGESGEGPEYAPSRYTTPNQGGSGAYGKFQMMPGTYRANAKYGDWSPLDQEIAARREYWQHGIQPWTNCTGG